MSKAIAGHLWADGIYVIYSTYIGAGPEGALRIAAFADHEIADFERLFSSLDQVLPKGENRRARAAS